MSTLIDLSVNYHQQDNGFCCGAACTQMLLVSQVEGGPHLGCDLASLPNKTYQQTVPQSPGLGLNREIQKVPFADFGAGAHPKAIKEVLNNRRNMSSYRGIQFKVFASTSRAEIICRIVHTLDEHGIAPAVLVYGGQHWVDVTGCIYDLVSGTTDQIEIIDFVINDPWPPLQPGASKVHSPTDQCIFEGDPHAQFSCGAWLSEYMDEPLPSSLDTGEFTVFTGNLNGCFIAVCAVHAPGSGKDNTAKYTAFTCV
ncbi:MAG TPA: hypothetical protein VEX13_16245 [Chloroflexia bacterium]|nr:hypothetical protein [Chloroflexia bacterium]